MITIYEINFIFCSKVFDEPIDDDVDSLSSDEQVYCFGFARWKKNKKVIMTKEDSTSIADTESWTTEEIEVDEDNVLDIEIEDSKHSSDELLSESFCKRKSKRKTGSFKRFVKAVGKLFGNKVIIIFFHLCL